MAGFLQKKFTLPQTPHVGVVRHIISDTTGGLARFLATQGRTLGNVPERYTQEIRRLIERALGESQKGALDRQPKYHGPVPVRRMEFRGGESTAIREWALEGIALFDNENLDLETIVD